KQEEANHKAINKQAIEDAKKLGKEAVTTEQARIARENVALAEAKKQEKVQQMAAKQADKARLATEKKARNAELKRKATSQVVKGLTEGQLHCDSTPIDDGEPADDSDDKFSLHPDDPANFLKLSSALHLLIKRKLTDHDINLAGKLIREYGVELIKLYGSAVLKPNHHYATHIGDCAQNFGPLHDFWMFLYEHFNKVANSKQHFSRSFRGRVNSADSYPLESLPSQTAHVMLKASNEEHGTVAGLAALSQELNDVSTDGK
ncbi:hypothetical protein PAXINDRAFT_11827, partial [Paxillus involutus ATCC 200175]